LSSRRPTELRRRLRLPSSAAASLVSFSSVSDSRMDWDVKSPESEPGDRLCEYSDDCDGATLDSEEVLGSDSGVWKLEGGSPLYVGQAGASSSPVGVKK
jgi:hypothetical protein